MIKQVSVALCSLALCTSAFATEVYEMLPGSITLKFPSNEAKIFSNPFPWSASANCVISTEDASNDLFAKVLAKKVRLNGAEYAAGQSVTVAVHKGDSLKLSADGYAKVELTNLGAHVVKAKCSI
jgi:hypothetical protein